MRKVKGMSGLLNIIKLTVASIIIMTLAACGGDGGAPASGPGIAAPEAIITYSPASPVAGDTVTLDGTGSVDLSGLTLEYAWTLTAPTGSSAALNNSAAAQPWFVVDKAGDYVVALVVSNGKVDSPQVSTTITVQNTAPVADIAYIPANPVEGDLIELDGSGSSDANGDPLTYSWTLSVPNGSSSALNDSTLSNPSFTADIPGVYGVSLVVSDGTDSSTAASATITVNSANAAPTAIIGYVPTTPVAGEAVTLDGTGSSDPEGDTLSYSWVLSAPAGSAATLGDSTADTTSFTVDKAGDYTVTLTVSDGINTSAETNQIITVANSIPVANITFTPSSPIINDTITLDGTGSTDANGDSLTYAWTLVPPLSSSAVLSDSTAAQPAFDADLAGEYTVNLVVSDGTDSSTTASVTINVAATANQAPVASFSYSPPSPTTGQTVNLDGSGSSDPEGQTLTYAWTLTPPAGSSATLSSTTASNPSFVADLAGDYLVSMVVSDGSLSDTASVTITAAAPNNPPTANISYFPTIPDLWVDVGLDGTGSSDPEGQTLTYAWTLTGPAGSSATLSSTTASQPSFAPDVEGSYTVTLEVSDGSLSDTASVTITTATSNNSPTANITYTPANPELGVAVNLDGTFSNDPEGDTLTYAWTLTPPAGSSAALDDAASPTPVFTPDVEGTYTVALVVNDGTTDSSQATVVITLSAPVADNQTFGATDVPLDIPDNNVSGIYSYLNVSGAATSITEITVAVDITHTWDGDLTLYLISPLGTMVTLSQGRGSSGDDYTGTVFSDAAATPISSGTPPFTGTFIPEEPLSTLNGQSANGTWALWVVDDATGDTGTITNFALTIAGDKQEFAPMASITANPLQPLPGATVTLDGSGSTDLNGDALTYAWTLVPPAGSSAALSDSTATAPTFTADIEGNYTVSLVANDGTQNSAPAIQVIQVSSVNTPPVAEFTYTPEIFELGVPVLLDGSASSDANGDTLTYAWTLVPPAGSGAFLDDSTAAQPTFTPDIPGEYTVELVVFDGTDFSDPVSVLVDMPAPDLTVEILAVTFDGVNTSVDFMITNNGPVDVPGGYSIGVWIDRATPPVLGDIPDLEDWIFATTNAGSSLYVTYTSDAFALTAGTAYALVDLYDEVIEPNETDNLSPAFVWDMGNIAPKGVISHSTILPVVGDTIALDGTGSWDFEGSPLTYAWTLTIPAGSSAALSDSTAAQPTFVADVAGLYTLELVVSDGTDTSTPVYQDISLVALPGLVQTAVDTPLDIPAGDSGGINSYIEVTGAPTSITNVVARVDITHTWDSDLSIYLISPQGTQVLLSSGNGGSANNYTDTIFSDAAVTSIEAGSAPFTGEYQPQEPLSVLNGENPNGTWRLWVVDTWLQDTGQILGFQLGIESAVANQAPVASATFTPASPVVSDTVTLSALGSTDPDLDSLSYSWSLTKPAGSSATLSDPLAAEPTFTIDVVGNYTATVTVSDGSLTDTASVTVSVGNTAPTASATVTPALPVAGDPVTVDASGSTDGEGDTLSYSWSLTKPAGSSATLSSASASAPSFTPDKAGDYTATVVVSDGSLTDTASVTFTIANVAPVASFSYLPATPTAGVRVDLFGIGSSDVNGDTLSYAWSLTKPAGSGAALSSATNSMPFFTPDRAGDYTISLLVSDGTLSDTASVTINIANVAPVASFYYLPASPVAGETVTLFGVDSIDINDDPLNYTWTLTAPAGSAASLINPDLSVSTFVVDKAGDYTISLLVSDGTLSDTISQTITIANVAPVASATFSPATPVAGEVVTLDASGSSDINGDTLTYSWSMTTPAGSNAGVSGDAEVAPNFVADKAGDYVATVVVSDGTLTSTASVTISFANVA
ncbi:MAG: PKD domain-containing protein, partial [Deltaproteobacteria bacterium]|nr:PKD domain-containing protein [Deltaproteobacteria bacterium]